ncbi:SDR family NAD(P)-dependent oxidoreductase [Salimicrobium halophilum]|uniref:3-oxoacyl-[acyl-carrier protein] reductase n=1 Tax=Salimicrobium halophilum TaxID=86666 RepID=A0A1G8VTG8_9BACI|nr:SDR family oxidoreductase [Salimicrobium halophilum]SDJ69127.1 3-oxoacyl-[acyl-carrier protein] reductase [Salimicrobium halophilum]
MLFSEDAFEGKHIVITGASRGIGRATAIHAVASGAMVTLTGRNEEKLQETKEACNSDEKVQVVAADINNEDDRQELVRKAEKFAPVTGLVNSAGILNTGYFDQISEKELREVMEVNYFSTAFLTQLFYSEMKERKEGSIVNVSSLSGLRGTDGMMAYTASKFAITGFTQTLALEAIRSNIHVNAVSPGFVDTEMGRHSIQSKADREGRTFEEQWEIAEKTNPSGRITTPEEVARAILFLLSDASENIVGESMKISGGSVMR